MKRLITGVVLAVLLGATLRSQPFSTEVQLAINQLVTGVVPFSAIRLVASSYLNWGNTQGTTGYGLRDSAGTIQVKNSGGSWSDVQTTASTITAAPFVTRTLDANLTNEFALSSLATAILINTTATGTPTAYAGATCGANQFATAVSAVGALTCAAVSAGGGGISGTVPVANGGTGITAGTSGGILAFTGTGTIASSALLGQFELLIGGGVAAAPTSLGSRGTTTTVLHGNAAGVPTFGAVALTTDVSGILGSANGGSANAFFAVAGPATSVKTFTLPNATSTILTTNAAVTAAQGGTGLASYTTGMILHATGAATIAGLADVAAGRYLRSGGVDTAPLWSTLVLPNATSTILTTNAAVTAAQGGTGLASYTTGMILHATGAATIAGLADVAVDNVLLSGGVGAVPAYGKVGLTTHVSGVLPIPNGGTGLSVYAVGDVVYASGTTTLAGLADVAAGRYLRSGGVNTAPLWSTLVLPNAANQGDVIVATAANTYGAVAAVGVGQVLASAGAGLVPAYTAAPALTSATLSDFLAIGATLFAALPAEANGRVRYCSDCVIGAVCAGAGTGAIAKRLNGAWSCT